MKEIPNDCLIVKPKEGVSPFTHLTWNSHNCPKTIPKDIYDLNEYRLDIVEDPHYLVWPDPKIEAQKAAEKEKAAALKDKDKNEDKDKDTEKEETKGEPEKAPVDLEKKDDDVPDAIKEGDLDKATDGVKDIFEKVKGHGKGKNTKR